MGKSLPEGIVGCTYALCANHSCVIYAALIQLSVY